MAKQLEDRIKTTGEVLEDIKRMLSDPNVKAVSRDNPIASKTTAGKVNKLIAYAAQSMLYVQMVMPTETRNRLVELTELSQTYHEAK